MRRSLLFVLFALASAPLLAQQPIEEARPRYAEDARDRMGFAYQPGQPWYGARRRGGAYDDQYPTDLYSRQVEHGAYSSSNSRYGFPLGIGLAAGFADVAAVPTGEGFAAGAFSPWYQMPYYWNSSTQGPVNTYMPYPGAYPFYGGYRPYWGGGYGPMPYPPLYGGGGFPGGGLPGGGFPGGGYGGGMFPGVNPIQPPPANPTFW